MEVAVSDSENCKKDITIEIPADEVKAEFDKTYTAYARYAKIPGFRPGHAPITVVKQRFRKDARDDVIKEMIPQALEHAIVDHKLQPVGPPEISDITVSEGESLRFKASVEVLPEFELKDYKGLKLTRRISPITDEMVDNVLEEWRRRGAQLVTVEDRVSEEGDFISVNLAGKFVSEENAEDLKADEVTVEVGGEGVPEEFSENLKGVKAGDKRNFRVAYREDFTSPGLAGKTVDFDATVVAVRRQEFPELDDDFAKEHDQETLEALRGSIRTDLEHMAESRSDQALREEAIRKLTGDYDFAIPDSLLDREAEQRLRDFANMLFRRGASPEMLREMDWEARRAEARNQAVDNVRGALVISKIAEAEGIQISEDEVNEEITRIATHTGESEEAVRAQLTKDESVSSIERRLRHQKALESIVNHAEITVEENAAETEVEPTEEDERDKREETKDAQPDESTEK
jgi:trigger factor